MDTAEDMKKTADYPLDFYMKAHHNLVEILNALGNEMRWRYSSTPRNGFVAPGMPSRSWASPKRYYSWIKDLLDTKLITKEKGEYRHTALGKYFYVIDVKLKKVLENRERLELLNEIGLSGSLS